MFCLLSQLPRCQEGAKLTEVHSPPLPIFLPLSLVFSNPSGSSYLPGALAVELWEMTAGEVFLLPPPPVFP